MAVVRGKDFKLYRNTDSPYDNSPTWREVVNVRDVTENVEAALADASIRGSIFRQQVSTLLDLSMDVQMVYDDSDTDLEAYEDAFYDRTYVETLALDGDINTIGSKGVRFMAQVTKFSNPQALEDVGLIDMTLVPGYFPTNLPRRVHVASPGSVVDS